MQPDDFPTNARNRSVREPKEVKVDKVVEKVVVGKVVQRKMPLGQRFLGIFVGGEAKGVGQYILMEIIVPAFKDLFYDTIAQGTERMIFGESRESSRRSTRHSYPSRQHGGHISYNRFARPSNPWDRERREEPRTISRQARAVHDFDQIVLDTRSEAETVLDRMYDLIARYDQVTVADLYALVGVTAQFTDEKWGWLDLTGSGVTRVSGGYLLDLPKPETID